MGGDIDDLAGKLADILVSAMLTDSWPQTRARFAAAIGQERRLDQSLAELAAVSSADRYLVRQSLIKAWAIRLRDLLDDNPAAAEPLHGLLKTPFPVPPATAGTWFPRPAEPQAAGVPVPGRPLTAPQPTAPPAAPPQASRSRRIAAIAAAVAVILALAAVTGWLTHWPAAVFGTSSPRLTTPSPHLTWPPTAWTRDSLPAAVAESDDGVIACPPAGPCILAATGSQGSTGSFVLYTASQGKWVQATTVPTSLASDGFYARAVTCPASDDCLVVGTDYEAVSSRTEVSAVTAKSPGGWTTTRLPLPAGSSPGESLQMSGIACPTAGDCVAVGDMSQTNPANNGSSQAVIATLQGGNWTVAMAPLPADAAPSPAATDLEGVACPAVGSCVAVGSYFSADGNDVPLIETLSTGTWQPGTAPVLDNTGDGLLYSVACPQPGTCVAVGNNVVGNNVGPSSDPGIIETLAHGTWHVSAAPQPTGAPGQFWGYLWAVACPAPGSCVAAGDYNTDVQQDSLPQFDTLSHGTWTAAIGGSLPADADKKGQHAEYYELACAPTGDCMARGDYTSDQGYQDSVTESTVPG
jgi:hypothetical protein